MIERCLYAVVTWVRGARWTLLWSLFAAWPLCATASELSASAATRALVPRALFDEDFRWVTPAGAEAYVATAKRLGFNVIVPCVWHGRGTSWPSTLAPMDSKLVGKVPIGSDPLRYLVEVAHKSGIQVHPWFTVFLKQGTLFEKYADPTTAGMYDVHQVGYHDVIAGLVREVVTRYPVDGINLDYVRSKSICSAPVCVERYRAATGRNLRMDLSTVDVSEAAYAAVRDYQRKAVVRALRRIRDEIQGIRPRLYISVDTIANDRKWSMLGVDAIEWANQGLVDFVFHMDYQSPLYLEHIEKARALFAAHDQFLVLVGNFDSEGAGVVRSRRGSDLARVVREGLNVNPNGAIGLYEFGFLNSEQELVLHELFETSPSVVR